MQAGCEPEPERGVQEGEGKEHRRVKERNRKKEYRKVNEVGESVDM